MKDIYNFPEVQSARSKKTFRHKYDDLNMKTRKKNQQKKKLLKTQIKPLEKHKHTVLYIIMNINYFG